MPQKINNKILVGYLNFNILPAYGYLWQQVQLIYHGINFEKRESGDKKKVLSNYDFL